VLVIASITSDGAEHCSSSDSDVSSLSESTVSSDSEPLRRDGSEGTPGFHDPGEHILQSYQEEVVAIIDRLFDISILVRGAGRNFRITKAAVHVEKDSEGNDLLAEFESITRLKIEWLYPEAPKWLVQRVATVVTMRRRQFCYQRAHKKRLSRVPSFFRKTVLVKHEARQAHGPSSVRQNEASVVVDGPKGTQSVAAKTTKSGTTTKTYETIATELLLNDPRADAVIANPTPFPMPPKEPVGKAFECNQCFHILPDSARNRGLWR
jgi:hypothetical protein